MVFGRTHRDDHKDVCSSRDCAHCDCAKCRWVHMLRLNRVMEAQILAEGDDG